MKDIISIFFSKEISITASQKALSISISQNFITCVFRSLHFLAQNICQKYTKIGKFKKYLGTQQNLKLKMTLNVNISS